MDVNMKKYFVAGIAALIVLSGCSSLSGVGGTTKLSCPLPDGTVCKPLSQIYADSRKPAAMAVGTSTKGAELVPATAMPAPTPRLAQGPSKTDLPLRSGPRSLRMWVVPFEDLDGDLYDEIKIYLHVDAGRWNVEHRREVSTKSFAPLKVPAAAAAPSTSAAPSGATKSNAGGGVTDAASLGLTVPATGDKREQ
jgi:conjugal transfer pilus assembly protein TraV